MIRCKKPGCEHMVLSLVLFAHTILDGDLYTLVRLIWKLIQSRIVPTLVLVDIFGFGNRGLPCKSIEDNFLQLDVAL